MFEEFQQTAKKIFETAQRDQLLIRNPDAAHLKALALEEPGVRQTKYGSIYADSEPMSRAARRTRNNIDGQFGQAERQLLDRAEQALAREPLVSIDVAVGDGSEGITARLIVPRRFAHVAYGGLKLFQPAAADDPTYQVVMFFDQHFEENKSKPLPEKDLDIRLAHSADGRMVKFVRNSNYFGEWKKGVFAGENYRVKLGGDAIFLHAGCRKDTLESRRGEYVTNYSLFVALSANGKTSTTCRVLARKGHERSWLIQDDGGTLHRNGQFRGFENGGLFIKTDCLNPGEQIEAYYASLRKDTFLENIAVLEDGSIDFYDMSRTSNGRAVVERRDFMHSANHINARRIDNLFIITRGNIIPAVAKLTHEQAAAFMVLGQSMESSAGDPTLAGTIKNEFFYDPFIAGDRSDHANLFTRSSKPIPTSTAICSIPAESAKAPLTRTLPWPIRWASSIRSSAAGPMNGIIPRRPASSSRTRSAPSIRSSCIPKNSSPPPTSMPGNRPSTASGRNTWTTTRVSIRQSPPSSRQKPSPEAMQGKK